MHAAGVASGSWQGVLCTATRMPARKQRQGQVCVCPHARRQHTRRRHNRPHLEDELTCSMQPVPHLKDHLERLHLVQVQACLLLPLVTKHAHPCAKACRGAWVADPPAHAQRCMGTTAHACPTQCSPVLAIGPPALPTARWRTHCSVCASPPPPQCPSARPRASRPWRVPARPRASAGQGRCA